MVDPMQIAGDLKMDLCGTWNCSGTRRTQQHVAQLNTIRTPYSHFTSTDADWAKKFHNWRMDGTPESIRRYLDNVLINTTMLSETINPDGSNPFTKPQYILLNLAIGGNGGNPEKTKFPFRYEVD